MAVNRTRNWATIVYPESAPENWQSLLADECVPAIISPLHDSDINPTGEPKKAHYHVMLLFAGVKNVDQVKEICSHFGGVQPKALSNAQGYARYLIHMDNPEKYQYERDKIVCLSGADWSSLVLTNKDRYDTLDEIIKDCLNHGVYSYSALVNHYRMTDRRKFEVSIDNTVFLSGYLKSLKWTMEYRDGITVKLNPAADKSARPDKKEQ